MIGLPTRYLLGLLDLEPVLFYLGYEQVVYYFLGLRYKLALVISSNRVNYLIGF